MHVFRTEGGLQGGGKISTRRDEKDGGRVEEFLNRGCNRRKDRIIFTKGDDLVRIIEYCTIVARVNFYVDF